MKTLFLILLFFISYSINSQILLNDCAYKAKTVTVFNGSENEYGEFVQIGDEDSYKVDVLFFISDKKIVASGLKEQLREFTLQDEFTQIKSYLPNIGYACNALDKDGIVTRISIMKEDIYGIYVIRIDYRNIRIIFLCNESDERPWDPYWSIK